jgi:MFS family permease
MIAHEIIDGYHEGLRVLALGAIPLFGLALIGPLVGVLLGRFGIADRALVYAIKLLALSAIVAALSASFVSQLVALTERVLG